MVVLGYWWWRSGVDVVVVAVVVTPFVRMAVVIVEQVQQLSV